MIDQGQRQRDIAQAIERLVTEQALAQLTTRSGRMAALATENGAIKLDWVSAGERYHAQPELLDRVEDKAAAILQQGIRHIIWAGMGGSVIIIHVLRALGFAGGDADDPLTIYPLDSTDPAAINAIVTAIAATKGIALAALDHAAQQALFADVLMVGVALGITSEEPITHLTWFRDVVQAADLIPSEHMLVMALAESLLTAYAVENDIPRLPLMPDGREGVSGRMSAPSTRVFLLPAALFLLSQSRDRRQLHAVVAEAWERVALSADLGQPALHPAVQVAATLSAASVGGVCQVMLTLPPGWDAFFLWLEQLCEESLGKGGKGLVIFREQPLPSKSEAPQRVHVALAADSAPAIADVVMRDADLASADRTRRLVALTALCWNWQVAVALYGYLQDIPFAGQPAVENYKSRARTLRLREHPLQEAAQEQPHAINDGGLTALPPPDFTTDETQLAPALVQALRDYPLTYLDLTINGELVPAVMQQIEQRLRRLGYRLGVPVKLRRAPADYHSTEQGEMDGPAGIVSIRALAQQAIPTLIGTYTPTFLHAQAVATWQAMNGAGRPCFLLIDAGTSSDLGAALSILLDEVTARLS